MVQGQRAGEQKTRIDVIKSPGGIKTLKGGAQSGEGKSKLCFHENSYLNICFFSFSKDFNEKLMASLCQL